MKKAFLSIVSFIFFFHALYGQEQPLNSQYFLNPYLYNPAFAGYDNRPAVFLGSRQQWTGIEGAPRTTYLTFHTPIAKVIPFGINIYNDSRGILSTTYALMTAGFRARFDEDDHYLSFALSGGAGFNSVDLSNVNIGGDPTLAAGLENNIFLDGNAGLLYHNDKFNFGVSFPKIFNNKTISQNSFEQGEFNPLGQGIGTLNYRLVVSEESFVIDPWVSYYYFENLDGQFEGTLRFILKDFFWVGGSYRMNYGASGFFGINIKDNFRFGYAYEMGASSVSGFSNGSHEFQIGLIFGKSEKQKRSSTNFYQRRRQMLNTMRSNTQPQQTQQQNQNLYKVENDPFKKEEPKQETTPTTPVTPPQKDKEEVDLNAFMEGYEEIKEDTVKEEPVKRVKKPEPVEPKKEEEKSILSTFEAPKVDEVTTRDESGIYIGPTTVKKGDHLLELEEGYYVIVGTFNSYRDAEEFSDKLFIQGFYTKFGYISQTTDYYVYIFHSPDNKQECVDTIDRFKQITTVLRNMWVLTVE